ncbi:MAG: hypothetical protein M0Z66_12495 [Thermaerobacter sp.]|nr:hypothetical protein [Thermaerobacter sp.]
MDTTAEGSPRKRSDRWAVRALWFVLLASAGFAAWSYWEGGVPAAGTFALTELISWVLGVVKLAVIFAILSLALSAWPGRRSFWLGTTVTSVLTAVPASIYSAATTVYYHNIAVSRTGSFVTRYLVFHNWPQNTAYLLLLCAVTAWVALLYFPKVRGWRFVVFWVVTVASGLPILAGPLRPFG